MMDRGRIMPLPISQLGGIRGQQLSCLRKQKSVPILSRHVQLARRVQTRERSEVHAKISLCSWLVALRIISHRTQMSVS